MIPKESDLKGRINLILRIYQAIKSLSRNSDPVGGGFSPPNIKSIKVDPQLNLQGVKRYVFFKSGEIAEL